MGVELPDAVFHRDGDRFVPTELARGPWDPNRSTAAPRERCSRGWSTTTTSDRPRMWLA